jgi:hypothetical protein
MSPHNKRIQQLVARGWSPYLGAGMLLWGFEICIFVVVARTYFPEADLNSWPCIAVMTPPLLVALYVNFFVETVLFVRAFARKKGRARTVHYLFPAGEAGKLRLIGRILLWVAGFREEAGVHSR